MGHSPMGMLGTRTVWIISGCLLQYYLLYLCFKFPSSRILLGFDVCESTWHQSILLLMYSYCIGDSQVGLTCFGGGRVHETHLASSELQFDNPSANATIKRRISRRIILVYNFWNGSSAASCEFASCIFSQPHSLLYKTSCNRYAHCVTS